MLFGTSSIKNVSSVKNFRIYQMFERATLCFWLEYPTSPVKFGQIFVLHTIESEKDLLRPGVDFIKSFKIVFKHQHIL